MTRSNFRLATAGAALFVVLAAQAQAGPTAVSSYRTAAQQQLDHDPQLRELVEDAAMPQLLRIAIMVAPNGRVVRETFIGAGGGNDERSAYEIMDEVGTMNFGAFTPDMSPTPIIFIWTIPRS